eukprot:3941465-Rhodomonas_salina.2
MEQAKHVLSYLSGSLDEVLVYHCQSEELANQIWEYADFDHAGDPDTRHSTTGYLMFMAGAAVAWQSKKQNLVALSSSEAEFYAASYAGCDVLYLCSMVQELGYEQHGPTPVFEDNWACIYLSLYSTMFHCTKHIDTWVFKLSEICDEGHMILQKVRTYEQVADAFTKELPKPAFILHHDIMLGKLTENITPMNQDDIDDLA